MLRSCCFLLCAVLSAQHRTISDEEVMSVHRSAMIIDTHNDVPMKTLKGFDITSEGGRGSTDLGRLKAGGVGATFFSAYVPGKFAEEGRAAEHATAMINTIRNDIVGKHPESFALATSVAEIEAARKQGKFAALIGIEGGHAIEDSLDKLRKFYSMGARYMTLTHTNTNNWADSSGDITKASIKHHNGLTPFGKQVITEMNRLGMIVDVSHVADKTFADVLAVSTAPVMASHSSCRALTNAPRNMTDDMIRALAVKGGVIHINFYCDFINETARKQSKSHVLKKFTDMDDQRAALEADKSFTRATLADVVAHIDHAVQVGGIDAVGIGSDFDGIECAPIGLEDVSKFPNLTRALLEKGYTAEQIRKIYGGNTLRLMRAVEAKRHP